jgi:hypothetical protein
MFIATLAFAGPEGREPVGRMAPSASAIQWIPSGSYDRISLRVTGPNGVMFQKEFASGSVPSFRMQDVEGELADGAYTFELRMIQRISDSVKKQLAAARAADDDAAIARIQKSAGIREETVQSGTLTVKNGSFINSANEEPAYRPAKATAAPSTGTPGTAATHNPTALDQVIADDLIVQGSLCVGFDCVNGEGFGADTIRLKENNLRILFMDTSTSAGFATTDWQLTANDQASGGAEKFSIDDITNSKTPFTVTGNSPTNSIFVASSGKVGFRTASPGLDLHISTGDTPAIRQEQTNASGFTAQTWDIGGNEANWFVRDLTGGSRLPFRIRPGAGTSSIDIASDGDVGISTASPNAFAKLDVFDSVQNKARITFTGQEFFAPSNTSTDGVAMILGTNRTNNRQMWIADTAAMAINSTNKVIRFLPNTAEISAIATDGGTVKDLLLQSAGGSVGVGIAVPLSKLHVNGGDIRVSNGSFIDDGTTLNVPDYVFESSYKLMPLKQLSDFVRTEKHLPNVPSAADVKANGANLSQLQMRLLEKVEELTLYTLDQHDQIGSLKSQNQMLVDRLAALEKTLAAQKQ